MEEDSELVRKASKSLSKLVQHKCTQTLEHINHIMSKMARVVGQQSGLHHA